MEEKVDSLFEKSIALKRKCINQGLGSIVRMGDAIVESILNGGKLLLCGNGGSAADAQHLAAELLVRLRPAYNRRGLPAISLAMDTSTITACGNDYSYDMLYSRTLESIGCSGDCLLGITTSGNSQNVYNAMELAKEMNIQTFGFLGAGGGKVLELCDEAFLVPGNETSRIQECHITAGHALMEHIENKLIEKKIHKSQMLKYIFKPCMLLVK
jgi:D-sedoheptulose 7-phosphate isomerase